MTNKMFKKNFGVFNSLFRYAPQRIEHAKIYPTKLGIYYCEKLGIYNCEKLGILDLLFTPPPTRAHLQCVRYKIAIKYFIFLFYVREEQISL